MTQKIKFLMFALPACLVSAAIHYFRLDRMHPQAALDKPFLYPMLHPYRLFPRLAVYHHVIRIPFERTVSNVPSHPLIKAIMQV